MTDQQQRQTFERDIRDFVVTNFLFGQDDGTLMPDESFLESGVVDSTGVLELVAFLEETYHIKIQDNELVPENLDSIHKAAAFVHRKRHG
jgi:acyl carrier protein